ncbi:hypothetical protein ANOM_005277 [Aspergillus nomiae NRRL 13137]|uniref:Uncharacterized protein n=1 Tax=Aspergillus nomiae NRRL (strain ATCC 15546 / NRRL 13137 / CBS 260.88 / M93) TaxID=1509407 RepID=A0A0L1J3X0_ASPN3|nr:uncharacterized protein ANOM_005277 [Aspergillus nomiae NRRL 13137]KNG86434.1 hypothetical protein ANOM_005277 [Aspergillus nomiae NRRL 13137]
MPKMDRREFRPSNSPGSTVGLTGLTSQAVTQSESNALDPKVGVGGISSPFSGLISPPCRHHLSPCDSWPDRLFTSIGFRFSIHLYSHTVARANEIDDSTKTSITGHPFCTSRPDCLIQ